MDRGFQSATTPLDDFALHMQDDDRLQDERRWRIVGDLELAPPTQFKRFPLTQARGTIAVSDLFSLSCGSGVFISTLDRKEKKGTRHSEDRKRRPQRSTRGVRDPTTEASNSIDIQCPSKAPRNVSSSTGRPILLTSRSPQSPNQHQHQHANVKRKGRTSQGLTMGFVLHLRIPTLSVFTWMKRPSTLFHRISYLHDAQKLNEKQANWGHGYPSRHLHAVPRFIRRLCPCVCMGLCTYKSSPGCILKWYRTRGFHHTFHCFFLVPLSSSLVEVFPLGMNGQA